VVVGTGKEGIDDGPLDNCSFRHPHALCQFDGTLFVTDLTAGTVRAVDGVLGTDWSIVKGIGCEASLTAMLLTAIPALPKELARVMAQYARLSGVRTIAGLPDLTGTADGHALREAKFHTPIGIAVDTSDAAAGPQLIIADHTYGLIRCLNLRKETITTIAGRMQCYPQDGPALQVGIAPSGVAVAPNGVVFVSATEAGAVRRISAPRRAANGSAERFITTVIGATASVQCLRMALAMPMALCLIPSVVPRAGPAATGRRAVTSAAVEGKDAVCLFVGCGDGVHSFDLARGGERKHFVIPGRHLWITALALDDRSGSLFAMTEMGEISRIDLRSGSVTELIARGDIGRLCPEIRKHSNSGLSDMLYDARTRSLIVSDFTTRRILRVRGIW
jgi:hypothetical protein